MEFTVSPKALLEALAHNVAEKRATLDIYTHAKFETSKNTLFITTCDGGRELQIGIPAKVTEEGSSTIEVMRLKSALNGLSGEVKFSFDGATESTTMSQGRRRYRFKGHPVEKFPLGPEIKESETVELDLKKLAAAIKAVAYAAGKADVRYYLNGVCLRGDWVVATSGHAIASAEIGANLPDCIIPNDSVQELIHALNMPNATLHKGMALEVKAEKYRFRSSLVEGKFPDFTRLVRIPSNAGSIKLQTKDILDSISRISVFAESTKLSGRVGVYMDGTNAILHSGNESAKDEFPAECVGDWPEVLMDINMLRNALTAAGTEITWYNPGSYEQQFFTADDGVAIHSVMPQKR